MRFGIINSALGDREMAFLRVGTCVVVETAIKQCERVVPALGFVEHAQVAADELADGGVDSLGILTVEVFSDGWQPPEEVSAIDEDCRLHRAIPRKRKSPRGSADP